MTKQEGKQMADKGWISGGGETMLYELMIVYRGTNWIYFETNEQDLWKAYAEYKHLMLRCRVNIGNMYLKRLEIRTNNEDYEVLDWNEIDEYGKWANHKEVNDMSSPNGCFDQELEEMWCELEDVLFDEDEDGELILSQDWEEFPKGTSRDEIWRFFDREHSKGVHWLLYDYGR